MKTANLLALLVTVATAACGGEDGPSARDQDRGAEGPAGGIVTDALTNAQVSQLVGLINGVEVAASKAVDAKLVVPAAREYARMLIADHTRLMAALPRFEGPQFPPPQAHGMNAVFRSQAAMLSTLPSGYPFDATFVGIQVADHAMAIDSLRRWHGVAEDAALRQAIAAAIPVMESHLQQAQALYSGLDQRVDGGASGARAPSPDTAAGDTLAPRTLTADSIPGLDRDTVPGTE